VVRELLDIHYDPGYATSMRRSFKHYGEAREIVARDRSREAMADLAKELVNSEG
jgi:tRNA 2-selenouridine synthase